MEIACMILLLLLIVLIYFSNRDNKVNKWGVLSGFFFLLGIFKEVYLYQIVPLLENVFSGTISYDFLTAPYSLLAWAADTLSMPAAIVMSLYFCGMDKKIPN